MLPDDFADEKNLDRRSVAKRAMDIAAKSIEFNRSRSFREFCFVSDIRDGVMTCGAISSSSGKIEATFEEYLFVLRIKADVSKCEELTLESFRRLLRSADCEKYIEDDDAVLELFSLDKICNPGVRFTFGENLLDDSLSKKEVFEVCDECFSNDTLRPELERIYMGRKESRVLGHPVHYLIETNSSETRKKVSRTILSALYGNRRLESRRYCYVDFRPGQPFSRISYDALYKSCAGGTVVVRYSSFDDSEDNGGYANSDLETVSVICEMMKKYRNQVLTVLCLPRGAERTKKVFFECLGPVGVVQICEDLADCARAKAYLRYLCRKQHIRADGRLFAGLEEDVRYYPDELNRMFDVWFDVKMKTTVFPQYKEIAAVSDEARMEAPAGNAYDDLAGMVGLSEAKKVIDKALNYYKMQRLYRDNGIKADRPAMHMVFTGNPGTAKTTVARLFARIMKENGLLSGGQFVEVGRGDLVGKYVGWTARTVQDRFREAKGGVLFIDEAYSLVDDRSGSFGDEAINTIVQEMENMREDIVVIFAGYPKEMETFLDKNPGLRSRIAFHVPFADYNTEELCEIAKSIGETKGVFLTPGAVEKLAMVFENARKTPDFGNGRYVRNLIEISKMNMAGRILSMDPEKITAGTLTSIVEEDIEVPVLKDEQKKHRIGFAS